MNTFTNSGRVIFLASFYPNKYSFKGPFMKEHAKSINSIKEKEVIVIAIQDYLEISRKSYYTETNVTGNLIEKIVYYNVWLNKYIPLKSVVRLLRMCIGVIKELKKIKLTKQDTILINVINPIGILFLYFKILGHKYYILEHSTTFVCDEYPNRNFVYKLLYWFCYHCSVGNITVSEFLGDAIIKHSLIKQYSVIPNVIDSARFKPDKSPINSPIPRFVFVGNLIHWKQPLKVLQALINVSNEAKQEIHFTCVGTGYLKNELEILTENLQYLKVSLIDTVDHNSIQLIYHSNDCIINYSIHETFCVSLYEAISCGLFALAPNLGAIPENFRTEYGNLHTNFASLEANIKYFIKNRDTLMSQEKKLERHNLVKRYFSQKVVGYKFHEILKLS